MTIRYRLPAHAAERVALAYSPLLEAVLSLHVLVEPKHHPAQHPWVRACRRLPPALKGEIRAFAFAYRSYFPEFLFPGPGGQLPSFESELDGLGRHPPEWIAFEFTRPFYGGAVPRDPGSLARPEVRRAILSAAAAREPEGLGLVRLALDDPAALLARFRELLASYWDAVFGTEWGRIEPGLSYAVSDAGRLIAR